MALGKLSVVLDANIAKFESDLGRASRIAQQQSAAMQRSFENAAKRIAGALTAAVSVGALASFAKKAVDLGASIDDLADKTGISAEKLSVYRMEALRVGSSLDEIKTGTMAFARAVSMAGQGSAQQSNAFKVMGINIRDTNGRVKDAGALLDETAKKLSTYSSGLNKSALAMVLFGRSGADLIPTFNKLGRDGIQKATEDAKAMGVYFSGEAAHAAQVFKEQLADVTMAVQGLGLGIAQKLLPYVAEQTALLSGVIRAWNAYDGQLDNSKGKTAEVGGVIATLAKGFALFELAVKDAAASLAFFYTLAKQSGNIVMNGKAFSPDQFAAEIQGRLNGKPGVGKGTPFSLDGVRKQVAAQFSALTDTFADNNREMMARFEAIDKAAQQAAKIGQAVKDATGMAPAIPGAPGKSKAVKAAEDYTKALRDQVLQLQMSGKAFELYQLAARGASIADLDYASSLIDVRDKLKAQADAQKELTDFVAQHRAEMQGVTDAELQFTDTMAMATKALDAHMMTWEQFSRIAGKAVEDLNGKAKDQFDQMSEFAKQAARNMQDAFADFLFDPFKHGLNGMLGDFADALRRMAAQAMAAKVFDSIGAWGKQNQSGGGWAGALAGFAGMFGGGKASGGYVGPYSAHQVNERGPELLSVGGKDFLMMGNQSGNVTPNSKLGGMTVNNYVNVQPTSTQRTASQVAQAVARKQQLALARA